MSHFELCGEGQQFQLKELKMLAIREWENGGRKPGAAVELLDYFKIFAYITLIKVMSKFKEKINLNLKIK